MLKVRNLEQYGDTIVEVLIAVGVVSLILVSSFTIANKSLKQIRMAQERTEAQKIAQASIEKLQYVFSNDVGNVKSLGKTNFCIEKNSTPPPYYVLIDSTPSASCVTAPRYKTVITQDAINRSRFNVSVTWDNLNAGIDQVVINYVVGP